MATRSGLVKKTPLEQYSRPKRGGIIAIKLREGDELVDAAVVGPGDEVILVTASGMAIRFRESDSRPMGRNTSGVKGIYAGWRRPCRRDGGRRSRSDAADRLRKRLRQTNQVRPQCGNWRRRMRQKKRASSSSARYRTQKRGGKGLRDIRTSERNGKVIGIARVNDEDEVFMMTAKGKLQRIEAADISVIGRNTQGVRIMNVDEGDSLVAVVRVPPEEATEEDDEATSLEASSDNDVRSLTLSPIRISPIRISTIPMNPTPMSIIRISPIRIIRLPRCEFTVPLRHAGL